MNRLLLRILAGVFLTMLAGSGLRILLFAHLYGNFFRDPAWYPIQSTATLVQDILDAAPLQQIDGEREFLSAALNRTIDIVDREAVPETLRQQLSDGKQRYGAFGEEKEMFYAPIHQGTRVVRFDPAFQSYRPSLPPSDFFTAFVWVSAIAAIIGFVLAAPLNRRLNDLEATVKKIRRGELRARTQIASSDLVGSIGHCFNQMADRIQSMIATQQTLLAATVQKFQAAMARLSGLVAELPRDKNPCALTATSQEIDTVIDELDQFVNDLLLHEKNFSAESSTAEDIEASETEVQSAQTTLRSGVRKFFFRTSIGILVALSFTHFFGLFMSQIGYRTVSFDPTWYPLRTTAILIQRAAATTPAETLPQRLEALRTKLGKRIVFLPAGSTPAPIGAVRIEPSSGITYGVYEGRKVFFAPVQSGTVIIDLDIQKYRRNPSLLFHVSVLPAQFIFVILGSMLLSLPIIANLKKLEEGIRKIREGDLSARVDVPRNNPVGPLAECFNDMADRIQALLVQQQHLVQAVAHEVRTPISRIRFHLEEMLMEEDAEVEQEIEDILEEINELNLLANELETFTTLDAARNEPIERAPIPLHDMLARILAYFQKTHGRLSLVLINPAEKEITLSAHPVLFRRAVQNILSNAIRHGESNVFIHYHADRTGIFVDIGDDGPGIPEDARETVFTPFIRLDGSRNRNTGGFGLGLAIVQRILALHGGAVSISDNSPRGTIVTTFWPHAPANLPCDKP